MKMFTETDSPRDIQFLLYKPKVLMKANYNQKAKPKGKKYYYTDS